MCVCVLMCAITWYITKRLCAFSASTASLSAVQMCLLLLLLLLLPLVLLLGGTAENENAAYSNSVSIRLSVCLSHSCTLLSPLDRMRCHLAGTLVWSK